MGYIVSSGLRFGRATNVPSFVPQISANRPCLLPLTTVSVFHDIVNFVTFDIEIWSVTGQDAIFALKLIDLL
jgi:hypothetical protein